MKLHVRSENKFDDKHRNFQLKINHDKCIDKDMTVKVYLLELFRYYFDPLLDHIQSTVQLRCCFVDLYCIIIDLQYVYIARDVTVKHVFC